MYMIPGVLVLVGNKTYGRYESQKRLLYKCIPYDREQDPCLVPYEMKQVGFSKVYANLYVVVSIVSPSPISPSPISPSPLLQETDTKRKHPIALLQVVIGPVDVIDHFYEYQLYCHNLHHSLQAFQRHVRAWATQKDLMTQRMTEENAKEKAKEKDLKTQRMTQRMTEEKALKTQRMTEEKAKEKDLKTQRMTEEKAEEKDVFIFTIDPDGTQDRDDALSYTRLPDGFSRVSVYIANVPYWIDQMQAWDKLTERVATLYLPTKNRPMLPVLLSEDWCSLTQGKDRQVVVLDVLCLKTSIQTITWRVDTVHISQNYVYESPELLANPHYHELRNLTEHLTEHLTENKEKVKKNTLDSHQVVQYWMEEMNRQGAKQLSLRGGGIYRSIVFDAEENGKEERENGKEERENGKERADIPDEVNTFLLAWKHTTSQYVAGPSGDYLTLTSPIRRLVDLLNLYQLQHQLGLGSFAQKNTKNTNRYAQQVYRNWTLRLDEVNRATKAMRKLQQQCFLIHLCYHDPTVLTRTYTAYGIEHDSSLAKESNESNEKKYKSIVYVPELKITMSLRTASPILLYHKPVQVQLYVFQDEATFTRKIRMSTLDR